jgi:carotenoid cleavage dioxygenase-like enzyme
MSRTCAAVLPREISRRDDAGSQRLGRAASLVERLSESPIAPRTGARDEADGSVVTFVSDIARGPIARIRLPHRISSGTHAAWVSEADLAKHGVR